MERRKERKEEGERKKGKEGKKWNNLTQRRIQQLIYFKLFGA